MFAEERGGGHGFTRSSQFFGHVCIPTQGLPEEAAGYIKTQLSFVAFAQGDILYRYKKITRFLFRVRMDGIGQDGCRRLLAQDETWVVGQNGFSEKYRFSEQAM